MRGSEPTWADLDDDLRSCVDHMIEGWPGGALAERLAARFADRAAAPVGGREPGTTGAKLIAAERQRQIDAEGWTPEHDASHKVGQLARAAECYVSHAWATLTGSEFEKRSKAGAVGPDHWPWWHWKVQTRSSDPADDIYGNWIIDGWKPSDDPIRDLVKAGALIAAEIDRLVPPAAVGGGEPADEHGEPKAGTLRRIADDIGAAGWQGYANTLNDFAGWLEAAAAPLRALDYTGDATMTITVWQEDGDWKADASGDLIAIQSAWVDRPSVAIRSLADQLTGADALPAPAPVEDAQEPPPVDPPEGEETQ